MSRIDHRSAKSYGAIIVIILTSAAVIGFFVWARWAELDQITRARGAVIPAGRVQILQSADGGVITDIRVREGQMVHKGDLLVALDQVKVQAAVSESLGNVANLKSIMARINAELFDKPLSFSPELNGYPQFTSTQRDLYEKRRQALKDQTANLNEALSLAKQELTMNEPLARAGDVSQADVLRMRRTVNDLSGEIVNIRNKYLQDLQTDYAKTQQDLSTAQQQLTQRGDSLEATELRAPTDGIVKKVSLTTVGGVLRAGDEALQIVPTGEDLIVEAKVSPRDIAFVKLNQTASVKFDAFDSSIYGSGKGVVSYVGPDTLTETRPDGAQEAYYRVHLTVNTSSMRPRGQVVKIDLQPGMTATVEIKTGQHTVFSYLTKPLMKTMSESLGER